jgi:hypothetical protein
VKRLPLGWLVLLERGTALRGGALEGVVGGCRLIGGATGFGLGLICSGMAMNRDYACGGDMLIGSSSRRIICELKPVRIIVKLFLLKTKNPSHSFDTVHALQVRRTLQGLVVLIQHAQTLATVLQSSGASVNAYTRGRCITAALQERLLGREREVT